MRTPFVYDRRAFLRACLASGAVILHPAIVANARAAPSEKIRIGMIGVGGQGGSNLKALMGSVVAVCDLDSQRLGKAKEDVEKANKVPCAAYSDYRKLLDSKDVDAVVVSTPDHWHALPTIDACLAGKDVYCEKPLTLTIAEGQVMVKAARKGNCIVQTGSQQRSDDKFRTACEQVVNGALGKIKSVKVGIAAVNFKGPAVADSDPPAELNYDVWLGPAPKRPYNKLHVHYNFRFFWDYSGGQLTNWGAHHLDIAQWGLGMDQSGPATIEGQARYHKEKWYEVPEWCAITYTYASGTVVTCSQDHKMGATFEGANGVWIYVNRGKIEASDPEFLKPVQLRDAVKLYVSKNHHGNWLECIRSRKLPICDVAIGHRSATVCHLGNIAIRSGKKVTWDPVKEQVVGDSEVAAMVSREYRAPWKLPEV
jgi:predicted dehydrogenase